MSSRLQLTLSAYWFLVIYGFDLTTLNRCCPCDIPTKYYPVPNWSHIMEEDDMVDGYLCLFWVVGGHVVIWFNVRWW
jgi:hypothetical protein